MSLKCSEKLEAMARSWPGGQAWFYSRFNGAAKAIMTDEQMEFAMTIIETFRKEDIAADEERKHHKARGDFRDPTNPEEWQDAVNTAELLLIVDSARQYGLITGGPQANIERCLFILAKGKKLGFFPQKKEV